MARVVWLVLMLLAVSFISHSLAGDTDIVKDKVAPTKSSPKKNWRPKCSSNEFACLTEPRCIPMKQRCDMIGNCHDGSDELNCPPVVCNATSGWLCANGQCLRSRDVRCNIRTDCDDWSDELNCTCTQWMGVGQFAFECLDKSRCVFGAERCNGIQDCRDGSDELNCECSQLSKLQCGTSSQCIERSRRCDGKLDCIDGSDEVGCNCQQWEFICDNNICVRAHHRCDGWDDCGDNSDEENCSESEINDRIHFECVSDGSMVEYQFVCDGTSDCEDKSDEANCSCPIPLYTCRNSSWFALGDMCQGVGYCYPPYDERICLYSASRLEVTVGESVSLECPSSPNETIVWRYHRLPTEHDEDDGFFLSTEDSVCTGVPTPRHSVISSEDTVSRSTLVIDRIQFNDTGLYTCVRDTGHGLINTTQFNLQVYHPRPDKYDYRLTMLTVVASIMAIYVILSVAYIVQQRLKTQGLYQSPSPVDDMTASTSETTESFF